MSITLSTAAVREIATILRNQNELLTQLFVDETPAAPVAPSKAERKAAKKARKAARTTPATDATPVVVAWRSNGLLTAASAKAIREQVAEYGYDLAINGNSRATEVLAELKSLGIPAVTEQPEQDAATVMAELRSRRVQPEPKAEAPKAGKKAKAPKAQKADKPLTQREQDAANGVSPEQRKAVNTAMAEHLRSMGVVPTGQAWAAAKAGERDAAALKALNAADGITGKATTKATAPAKAPKKAPKAPKAQPEAGALVAALSVEDRVALLVEAGFTALEAATLVAERVNA